MGRRLAYAAAKLLKKQQRRRAGVAVPDLDGAVTGPTLSGCSYSASESAASGLTLKFNASLLGGEGLMLRPFDANETGGWGLPGPEPASAGPLTKVSDSNGAMVCTVDPTCTPSSNHICGNITTCHCQSWNFVKLGYCNSSGCPMKSSWYCEVGPGWKPSAEAVAEDAHNRREHQTQLQHQQQLHRGHPHTNGRLHGHSGAVQFPMLGWVPSPCPFVRQWRPAPLRAIGGSPGAVSVDMGAPLLAGLTPLAVRLAWPLFDIAYNPADTCCPTAAIQAGRGVCVPGNCPLYSASSELPANPFFATISSGKCHCRAPQDCSA